MEKLPRLYKDKPDLKLANQYVSDEVYEKAMDAFVIVTADALFINREKKTLYLAKRKAKPVNNWYMTGGRLRKGETELEGAKRNVKRETGLDLADERFEYIGLRRFWWQDREQHPQENGADTLIFIFTVELSSKEMELASQNLDNKEYESDLGLKEFSRGDIINNNLHPVLVEIYDLIFPDN